MLTALAVNHVYMRANKDILIDAAISDLRNETAAFKFPLKIVVEEMKEDLRFLSGMRPLRGWLRARAAEDGVDPISGIAASEWRERVAGAFEDVMATRGYYMQIRYIDESGMETLRYNVNADNNPVRVPQSDLQDKSNRSYVTKTLNMPRGSIFFSEPNLNREGGELEVPYKLTLRAASPTYSSVGVEGVIVINLDLGAMLERVQNETQSSRLFYVTNGSGDYLLHPDRFALFASDLGHKRRLQSDRPAILEFSEEKAQRGAIYVPKEGHNANVLSYVKYNFDAGNRKNFIAIAMEKPYKDIMARAEEVKSRGYIAAALVAVVLAPLSLAALYFLLKPLRSITRAMVRYRQGEKNVVIPDAKSADELGMLAQEFINLTRAYGEEDWIKEKKLEICGDLLHCRTMEEFGKRMASNIAPAVGAQLAAVYIREDMFGKTDCSDAKKRYKTAGMWGFNPQEYRKSTLEEGFSLGEGLAGACAVEGIMTELNVPKNYLHICSGLGETHAANLIFLPVPLGKEPIAVVELASLGEFSSMRKHFLSQLSFFLDLTIRQTSASVKAAYLLEVAEHSAEELRTQQEELEVANKEMEEKNDELREQAAELEESQKQVQEKITALQMADKYKSEFMANMSHELRTPLNSMLILSDSWKKNEEGNLTDAQIEEADIVHSGGLELLNLINDILDLSKIESGNVGAESGEFEIKKLIDKLEKQFRPQARNKNLTFTVTLDPDLPENMYSDRRRIDQILKNLLANAVKFTHEGEVTLNVALQGADNVAFTVTDTGIGIKREKHKEIFEAFRQEDGAIDRRYGGTGLGLTIAKKFAALLGGDVTVEGKKGVGSAFTVTLPIRLESENKSDKRHEKAGDYAPPAPRKSVLLAVESSDHMSFLKRMATVRHVELIHKNSAREALSTVGEGSVGAVLLPLTLSSMPTEDFLQQLEKKAPSLRAVIYSDSKINEQEYMKLRRFTDHIVLAGETSSEDVLADEIASILSSVVSKEDKLPNLKMRHDDKKALTGRKILVVDDDLRNSFALCRALKNQGMKTVVADNGAMGMQKLEEHGDLDLILTDIMMPEMDGYSFIRAVRANSAYKSVPIIALTAYAMPDEQDKCMEAGADDYLSKPVDIDRTLNLLRVWLFKQEDAA